MASSKETNLASVSLRSGGYENEYDFSIVGGRTIFMTNSFLKLGLVSDTLFNCISTLVQ